MTPVSFKLRLFHICEWIFIETRLLKTIYKHMFDWLTAWLTEEEAMRSKHLDDMVFIHQPDESKKKKYK